MSLDSPDPALSEDFRQHAFAEREKLLGLYQDCCARHAALVEQTSELALEAERYLRTIRELGQLLGVEDQLSIHDLTPELRGELLRQVAADVLFRHFKKSDPPFHYKAWLKLVVAEGHRIGGKNPAATFLTQIARIDGVERVGRRTGLYRVVA